MTTPTKSPVSPLMEPAPTGRDGYVSLSSNAIGADLMVARFWIPPGTDSAGGVWSVLTIIIYFPHNLFSLSGHLRPPLKRAVMF
jgi:hypothetical protein